MQNTNIVYFELNNWTCGKDYPAAEPFESWMGDDLNLQFLDDEWVLENKLCVVVDFVDQSLNFCITAPEEWVLANCPELLTEHSKFVRTAQEDGTVYGRFGHEFLEYNSDNIGLIWQHDLNPDLCC